MKAIRVIAIALMLALSVCLFGCAGSIKSASATTANVNTVEELEEVIAKDVDGTVAALAAELDRLESEVDTFEKYGDGSVTKEFYETVYSETEQLCIRMCEYALRYAEIVVGGEGSYEDKRDAMEGMYDALYEDAFEDIYDGIYEDLFDDAYDVFYDGLLADRSDDVEYEDWSDARSNEYEIRSDIRSDVYEIRSDCRSDVYSFYSDVRSELWSEDDERLAEKMEDFRADIEDLREDQVAEAPLLAASSEAQSKASEEGESSESEDSSDIDSDFKAAMDSYEEFFDSYVEFMGKFEENPSDPELLSSYGEFMTQYAETMEEMESIDQDSLNEAELAYYLEVTLRIEEKLLNAAL